MTHQRLDHVTQQLFSPHLESLSLIMDDLAHIQRTETVNAKEDLASWDMALVVFDLIREEFAELQVTEAAATDSAAPVKLPKKVKPAAKPAQP